MSVCPLKISCLSQVQFLTEAREQPEAPNPEAFVFRVTRDSRVHDLPFGWYFSPNGNAKCIRLGPARYNHFRNALAQMTFYPRASEGPLPYLAGATGPMGPYDGPFIELLRFSDKMGCLLEPVCAKLDKDFDRYRDRAQKELDETSLEIYWAMKSLLYRAVTFHGCLYFQTVLE